MMIAGETGAGKTALLDAMAYALFGGSTGGARDENSYRSHHAAAGCLTYVDFQFELQGQLYRAIRYPGQKGKSQGQYELRRITAIGDGEGELLASKKSAMSDEVERLLGYNLKQFSSVVVLPQGQFRKFLGAKTDIKAAILSGLFRTFRYRRLEEGLKIRAKKLSDAQSDMHKQITGILERADTENDEALAEQIKVLKQQVGATQGEVELLEKVTAACAADEKDASDLKAKFTGLKEANAAIDELEAQATERSVREASLQRARRSAVVAPVESSRDERREEQADLTKQFEEARSALVGALTTLETATEALAVAEARVPETEAAQGNLVSLQGLREQVGKLSELEALEKAQAEALATAAGEVERTQQAQGEAQGSLKTLEEQLGAEQLLAAGLGSAEAEHDTSSVRLKQRQQLDELGQNLAERVRVVVRAEEKQERRARAAGAAKETFHDYYGRHLADYAAQLAAGLADGESCPVCGAQEHPNKASPQEGAPDKQAVDEARAVWDKAEKQKADGAEAVRDAEAERAKVAAQVKLREEVLGEHLGTPLEELEQAAAAAKLKLDLATEASQAVPETEAKLATAKSTLEALATTAVEAQEKCREVDGLLNGTRLLAAEQAKTIPEDLRSLAAVEGRISATETAIRGLKVALEGARAKESKAREELATAKTTETNVEGSLAVGTRKLAEAEAALNKALAEGEFATEQAYREARREPAELEDLAGWLKDYDEQLNRLRGQIEQLAGEVEGREAPDLEAAAAATDDAKLGEDAKREELTGLHKLLSPKEIGLGNIRDLRARHAAREAQCRIMQSLSNAAQGDNSRRLKFERYVLAGLLDEVLVHASRRLKRMSSGRYVIQRKDPFRAKRALEAKMDKRTQAGLEIEVLDAFTGKERDAATLSGGEGFQASLALALGLADVIQAQSGGIELSAMFIDEGFGTQSSEALDSVLDTLTALQDSGRLVGFISHVDGMKDRIPAKLIVTKTPTGSRAAFKVS
jgi:exonuclease SbcC